MRTHAMTIFAVIAPLIGCTHAAEGPRDSASTGVALANLKLSYDLVSPLTASGVEEPKEMTWAPGVGARNSSAVFKNVQLLGALPAARLMAGMQSMGPSVGARCDTCHLEKDFKADDKPAKVAARRMLKMADAIDRQYFGSAPRVTCFTCHLGAEKPPAFDMKAAMAAKEWPLPPLSPEDGQKPAEQVYKHVVQFQGMPAARLPMVMRAFSAALGVSCTHCHVEGKWESEEKPQKQRAREMAQLGQMVEREFYGEGKTKVSCTTCHRGEVKPARVPLARN